ncbi:MFS transporter [Nocardiopsis sp. FIRDI 009]|uniref:MFS transporter n=1 Tax=Nocardiopsis sp. FIRDI 009 TaxID=714197 RepID=UPI001E371249|nr:MFS transporter [Nocardiopsis sp. FIRDI 009]
MVLVLPTLLVSLDIGVLFLALPHLSADLGASSTQQLWITDMYGFMLSGFLITMGSLGDRIGRRRLLLIGAACFGAASVAAAYSPTPETMIVARGLLGVAGAAMMPSTLSLITTLFQNDRQRGLAIGIWVSSMMSGAALGPVVGGVLLQLFWWGSAFLLGVPVMVLLLVSGPLVLPEFRNPGASRIDLPSAVLSLAAVLPVVFAVKEVAVHGLDTATLSGAALLVGLVFAVVFVRRQLRLDDPLLDLRLFAERRFSGALLAMLFTAVSLAGTFLLVSQYVQSVEGFSPGQAGLWLAPAGLSIAVGSLTAPMLTRRMSPGAVIAGGLVLGTAGFLMISQAPVTGGALLVVAGISVAHLGAGPVVALGANLVVSSAPQEKAGSAASMSETANHFGSTLGLALIGTLSAVVYRRAMADAFPEGAPGNAGETLPGAAEASAELGGGAGEALLSSAQSAFTSGLNAAGVVGAVIFVCLAALAMLVLRTPRGDAAAEAAPGDDVRDPAGDSSG